MQQHKVFQSELPGYNITLLCGTDGVEHWTDQSTWDAVLSNVRVVLSTHAVLLDALTHGFVKLPRVALLIFDEGCSQHALQMEDYLISVQRITAYLSIPPIKS
jgi:ERCC4-related helicase